MPLQRMQRGVRNMIIFKQGLRRSKVRVSPKIEALMNCPENDLLITVSTNYFPVLAITLVAFTTCGKAS